MSCRRQNSQLLQFLKTELAISDEAIAMALKHPEHPEAPLHMILWGYGLLSSEQLSQIFDWLVRLVD
ncbi:DUF2949 domain-containing protein [Oscillatoria sp. FACHB-1407]|uniref:DUF2949 domain-containing protein n=1 Tax=Oscillatoria sp. FACHB-1407 TaxID=2692847 RepID=UPI0016867A3B|nr:DUF2949 domain-containing protein [Oscillatoria sp. FACHB-1407]MBD2459892.1 DUF2949 domain-containing protein [Oscillatoria sp. FACHB-1407]